jgi:Flp pilus assembly pilin Flp
MNRKFSTKRNEKGQGLVEYALLSVFVSIVLISVLTAFGPEIKVLATSLMDSFTGGDFSVHEGELIIPGMSPSLTPSATPVPTWTTCANENGVCSFSGTALVRYGANGIWVTQTYTNGVSCTNAVFGDPISGVAKTCQVYPITSPTPIASPTPTASPVPTALACTPGSATVANESACSNLSASNGCESYRFRRWSSLCTWP